MPLVGSSLGGWVGGRWVSTGWDANFVAGGYNGAQGAPPTTSGEDSAVYASGEAPSELQAEASEKAGEAINTAQVFYAITDVFDAAPASSDPQKPATEGVPTDSAYQAVALVRTGDMIPQPLAWLAMQLVEFFA